MSPKEELLAAVKALRCEHSWSVANVAPPGPCEKCGIPWSEAPIVAERVAEPLAAWLETVAAVVATYRSLAIARAILNGGES
jgi:hypothetical protein